MIKYVIKKGSKYYVDNLSQDFWSEDIHHPDLLILDSRNESYAEAEKGERIVAIQVTHKEVDNH